MKLVYSSLWHEYYLLHLEVSLGFLLGFLPLTFPNTHSGAQNLPGKRLACELSEMWEVQEDTQSGTTLSGRKYSECNESHPVLLVYMYMWLITITRYLRKLLYQFFPRQWKGRIYISCTVLTSFTSSAHLVWLRNVYPYYVHSLCD